MYSIVNKVNGNEYVGSTIRSVQSRWNTHVSRLRRNRHHSYKLQSAWNKYGEENFELKLRIICERSDMLSYEAGLIKFAKYNIAKDPTRNGIEKRWEGHVKALPKPKSQVSRSQLTKNMWANPKIRENLVNGLRIAAKNPDSRLRKSLASKQRKQTESTIEKIARAKWRPLYCKELQVTFLSGKFAAEYLGVLRTSISNAIKSKGKVCGGLYTFEKVNQN